MGAFVPEDSDRQGCCKATQVLLRGLVARYRVCLGLVYHDGCAGPSQHETPEAPDETTPVPAPRNPAVAAPWPYRAAFLGPPLCHWSSRPRKTPSHGSGERKRTPPCANPPYVTATPSRGPGERVGTPEVVHEVIRTRIRPRAGGDFRRGVWHEKTPPEPSVLAHAGFGTLAYVWYCYHVTKRPRRPSTPGACQRNPFSNRLGQYRSPPGAPGRARR